MTNDRIQKWLATFARIEANRAAIDERPGQLSLDAAEIIRFLAGPDGALLIADEAACELIVSECRSYEDGGMTYWEIEPLQSAMDLDEDEIDLARSIGRAVRYLSVRGLIAAHPENARFVRPLVDQ